MITDLKNDEQKIYGLLKCRIEIEQLIGTFKNVLEREAYMQDDYSLEGWMFINFIALIFYYRIHRLLTEKNSIE